MYRYIGNKTKLLSELMIAISEKTFPNSTIVDLMAGTGSVSVELRKRGYRVIASDMMTYSKHHLVSQLLLNTSPEFNKLVKTFPCVFSSERNNYEAVINYLNSLTPIKGYFYNEFSPEGIPANGTPSRKYFTSENAQKIDAIRETINNWINDELITSTEESLLKHTLILAVNDVANISGTYGYFLSTFNKSSLNQIELKPIDFITEGSIDNIVIQGFAEDIAKEITADLCYIDPPYIKRQYAANYHILETIARGDFPEARGKSGLRNWWDQHSKFCTKTKIKDSFELVISSMHCDKFLISYSEDGLLSLQQLISILEPFGKVSYQTIKYSRFRSNKSSLSKNLSEFLIYLEKR